VGADLHRPTTSQSSPGRSEGPLSSNPHAVQTLSGRDPSASPPSGRTLIRPAAAIWDVNGGTLAWANGGARAGSLFRSLGSAVTAGERRCRNGDAQEPLELLPEGDLATSSPSPQSIGRERTLALACRSNRRPRFSTSVAARRLPCGRERSSALRPLPRAARPNRTATTLSSGDTGG